MADKTRLSVAVTLSGLGNASEECYFAALRLAGLEPLPIAADASPEAIDAAVRSAGGLLLSGGPDVHPERYGEEVDGSDVTDSSIVRDAMEFAAAAAADAAGMPILAICRGAQMLNVHRGGALLQDIGESHRDGRPQKQKWMAFHPVEADGTSRLAGVLGSTDAEVNSRHHQAIDPARTGDGLAIVARCPADGIVEAIEGTDPRRFVLGVQWHPENMALAPKDSLERAQARAIFEAFAVAVRERVGAAAGR